MATFNVEMRQRVSGAFSDIIYPKAHWGNIDGKPATFAPTTHTHDIDDIDATGTPSATTYLRGDGAWATPEGGGGGSSLISIKNWTGRINVGGSGAAVDLPLSENIEDGNKYIIVWSSGSGIEYMSMFVARASGNISLFYAYGASNSVYSYGFQLSQNTSYTNRFKTSGYFYYELYSDSQEFSGGTTSYTSFYIVDILKVN